MKACAEYIYFKKNSWKIDTDTKLFPDKLLITTFVLFEPFVSPNL